MGTTLRASAFVSRVFDKWIDSDRDAAVTHLYSLEDSELTRKLQLALASRWSQDDPAAAAAFAITVEHNSTRLKAAGQVARNWLRLDSFFASAWIDKLPVGPVRDAAVEELIEHVRPGDPDSALEWAQSLDDPGARARMVQVVLEN